MLPYNTAEALTGFDLRSTYRKAKGKGTSLINKFLGLGDVFSRKAPPVSGQPASQITARDIKMGNVAEVKRKLKQGANPDIFVFKNSSALHWSCNTGKVNIVRLLLAHGATPNTVNGRKMTALDVLLNTDRRGKAPLDRMSAEQQTEIQALLEKAGGKRSLREPSTQE